jgi:hypothetical protein
MYMNIQKKYLATFQKTIKIHKEAPYEPEIDSPIDEKVYF